MKLKLALKKRSYRRYDAGTKRYRVVWPSLYQSYSDQEFAVFEMLASQIIADLTRVQSDTVTVWYGLSYHTNACTMRVCINLR